MENATKAILFGAGIVITLVLVSLGFILLRNATGTVDQQLSDMEQQKQQVLDQKYTKYDGKTVTGAEVRNALEEFKDAGIAIRILTLKNKAAGGNGEYYFYDLKADFTNDDTYDDDISDTKDKAEDNYVNPSGKFVGTILRDPNKSITGIQFTQQ